jgi:signal transduction histidine kinase/FixJ family two-component response regulator
MKDLQFQFKGYDSGAVDYLTKPIEPIFLQSKVKVFTELYRQRREIELHNIKLEELVSQRTLELHQSAEELKKSNEQLNYWNRELKATEELLRGQITEFVETHDQLLATEEMLRVQIEEYEAAQILLKESNITLQSLLDEQKRMEDQIRQTQKMEIVGQLAGGVAHDFNNMLTAILGSAELLQKHIMNDPAAMKLLTSIQQAATRSADLTGQLLVFSRKGQKNVVQIRIDTAIHEVISLLERTIDKKIKLETRLVAKNACVIGDPALLQNALLNLGVNARDAMPEGGVVTFATAFVELDSDYCDSNAFDLSPGQFIEISVSDTGTGISKENLPRVFEPFFTTKDVGKGTGLGLAAVYGTIKEHHGCINICSEPGIGTVFKLYLPVTGERKPEITHSEELIPGTGGVLLVDDEELLRNIGQAILEELGYRVFLACNGEQALEVYAREREHISLVILDVVMPVMDGKEALVKLKEKYPDIRVLIASGFNQIGTVDEFVTLGAKGFLKKPYYRQELCKAVAESIQTDEQEKT